MQLNYIFFQSLPFPQFPSQPKQTSQRLTQIKECGTSQSLMEVISLVLWHFIWVNRGSKKWKVTDNYLTLRRSFCFFDSCNFCHLMSHTQICFQQDMQFYDIRSKTITKSNLEWQSKLKRECGGLPVRER